MISVNCVKGRLFRPKNDKSTDSLAFIILSQFKSMYLFKKKQKKTTHYNCNYLNLKLLILFLDHCVHFKPANIWHPTLQELWEYMKFRSKFSHLMSVSLLYSFCKNELDFWVRKLSPYFMVHVYMHGDHATLIFECSTRRSGKISHEKMFIFLKTSIHQFLPSPN